MNERPVATGSVEAAVAPDVVHTIKGLFDFFIELLEPNKEFRVVQTVTSTEESTAPDVPATQTVAQIFTKYGDTITISYFIMISLLIICEHGFYRVSCR